jgi:hypothetical protein
VGFIQRTAKSLSGGVWFQSLVGTIHTSLAADLRRPRVVNNLLVKTPRISFFAPLKFPGMTIALSCTKLVRFLGCSLQSVFMTPAAVNLGLWAATVLVRN